MDHIEELEKQFSDNRDSLARLDVDIESQEMRLLRENRGSLKWFQNLAVLNSLQQKRKLVCARLATLRIMINQIENPNKVHEA